MICFIDTECRCGNEQQHVIEMSEDYSDDELRIALDDQTRECDECGGVDWIVS